MSSDEKKPHRPNIVFVLTDGQGYGDLGCHSNPVIKTSAIDRFHDRAARFMQFHVGITCTPSWSGLITGMNCNSIGVWHTIGGGLTRISDHWGNTYIDDTYLVNGEPKMFKGYCTDEFFGEASKFITAHKDEPFCCFITPNALHVPFNVEKKYRDLCDAEDISENRKQFYGMVSNIGENFQRLETLLRDLNLEADTMTDNGTDGCCDEDENQFVTSGFNAGMCARFSGGRGEKTAAMMSPYYITIRKVSEIQVINH